MARRGGDWRFPATLPTRTASMVSERSFAADLGDGPDGKATSWRFHLGSDDRLISSLKRSSKQWDPGDLFQNQRRSGFGDDYWAPPPRSNSISSRTAGLFSTRWDQRNDGRQVFDEMPKQQNEVMVEGVRRNTEEKELDNSGTNGDLDDQEEVASPWVTPLRVSSRVHLGKPLKELQKSLQALDEMASRIGKRSRVTVSTRFLNHVQELLDRIPEGVCKTPGVIGRLMSLFRHVKQVNSVGEYAICFVETVKVVINFVAQVNYKLEEQFLVMTFLVGLKEELRYDVQILEPKTLSEAIDFAQVQEKEFQSRPAELRDTIPGLMRALRLRFETKSQRKKPQRGEIGPAANSQLSSICNHKTTARHQVLDEVLAKESIQRTVKEESTTTADTHAKLSCVNVNVSCSDGGLIDSESECEVEEVVKSVPGMLPKIAMGATCACLKAQEDSTSDASESHNNYEDDSLGVGDELSSNYDSYTSGKSHETQKNHKDCKEQQAQKVEDSELAVVAVVSTGDGWLEMGDTSFGNNNSSNTSKSDIEQVLNQNFCDKQKLGTIAIHDVSLAESKTGNKLVMLELMILSTGANLYKEAMELSDEAYSHLGPDIKNTSEMELMNKTQLQMDYIAVFDPGGEAKELPSIQIILEGLLKEEGKMKKKDGKIHHSLNPNWSSPAAAKEVVDAAAFYRPQQYKSKTVDEALSETVRCSKMPETSNMRGQPLLEVLIRLSKTIDIQIVSSDDREKQSDLQALLCNVLQGLLSGARDNLLQQNKKFGKMVLIFDPGGSEEACQTFQHEGENANFIMIILEKAIHGVVQVCPKEGMVVFFAELQNPLTAITPLPCSPLSCSSADTTGFRLRRKGKQRLQIRRETNSGVSIDTISNFKLSFLQQILRHVYPYDDLEDKVEVKGGDLMQARVSPPATVVIGEDTGELGSRYSAVGHATVKTDTRIRPRSLGSLARREGTLKGEDDREPLNGALAFECQPLDRDQ